MNGVWYLPHFATSQAKFRVVYYGAAQYLGTSINDHILPGSDLLTSLFNVLSRFHLGEYAITVDLWEDFFQVGIPEHQRDFFRLLRLEDGGIKDRKIKI